MGKNVNYGNALNRRHPLARGLVGFWLPLRGRGTGATLFDLAGRNHGTLTNGPTWTTGPNGFGALSFDGSNDSVDLGDPAALDLGSASFTLSAWVRMRTASASGVQLIGRGDASPTRLASIDIQAAATGKPQIQLFDGSNNPFARHASDISGTGWRHVVGVLGGGLLTLYVDGEFSASATDTAGSVSGGSGAAWTIGRRLDTGGTIDGDIGLTSVHLRAMPADEVRAFYRETRAGFPTLLNRTRRRSFAFAGASGPTYTLTADVGTFTLTGNAATLTAGRLLTAAVGSFALTGNNAGLTVSRLLTAEAGSFALTGNDTGLTVGRALTADTGAFTLTGNDAGLTAGRLLTAASGTFTLTGYDATLTYTPAGITYTLTANTGAFVLTGNSAGLVVSRVLTAAVGTFTLTGNAATLTYSGAAPATPTGRRCATWESPTRTATWSGDYRTARWYDDLCTC